MNNVKRFPTSLVLTAYTGIVVHNPSEVKPFVEWLLNEPILTHEFHNYRSRVREEMEKQMPDFKLVSIEGVDSLNWPSWLSYYELMFDTVMELTQLPNDEKEKNSGADFALVVKN